MNRKLELSQRFKERVHNIGYEMTSQHSKEFTHEFIEAMRELIIENGLEIVGVGKFVHEIKPPRLVRDPRTGEKIMSKSKIGIKYIKPTGFKDIK